MAEKIHLYDTTLRDGMQGVGAHFTLDDKVKLARLLDSMGVSYIEGGGPGFNPKDAEFFARMEREPLKHSRLVAFGSTCRTDSTASEDRGLRLLGDTSAPCVCVYGKAWKLHVDKVLGTTPEHNLELIKDSVSYLKDRGKEVFFDAEHFFDGYEDDPVYAAAVVKCAFQAGASRVFLCDTNGGTDTERMIAILESPEIKGLQHIGLHAHNDMGMAVANAVAAAGHGADCLQVTLNGIGERCGNTDLFCVLPGLQEKLGFCCVPEDTVKNLTAYYYKASDILNMKAFSRAPYVGRDAFSHKGGTHIDAMLKDARAYEHMAPETVGNTRRMVLSEVSGKAAVNAKIEKLFPDLTVDKTAVSTVLERLKNLEFEGFQFEGADASFELMVRRTLGINKSFFKLIDYKIVAAGRNSCAIVDVCVGDQEEVTAANGMGPVDALDKAFRKALGRFYPELNKMRLVDYKVRVLDSGMATASKVRVLIESTDGEKNWVTVGVSEDIIEASWQALVDAHEYMLYSSNMPKNSG
jgi:2-isopropylmalate synthase